MTDLSERTLEQACEEIKAMQRDRGELIAIKPTWCWFPVPERSMNMDEQRLQQITKELHDARILLVALGASNVAHLGLLDQVKHRIQFEKAKKRFNRAEKAVEDFIEGAINEP